MEPSPMLETSWKFEESPLGRIVVPPAVPAGSALFYTTRDFDGFLSNGNGERIAALVRERSAIDASLATCNQVHGADLRRVRASADEGECDACDALWSDERQVALGIKVADCLPVTMIDSTHSVIANVHSGWRGAVQGITARAIQHLTSESRFRSADALAYLGPSIRRCCFEVGEEVAERFTGPFVDRTRPKPHVDLAAYTVDLLLREGWKRENIFDSELCTRCDGRFHSYRRDGKGGGRNLAIVAQ